jgi:hypothetical protein
MAAPIFGRLQRQNAPNSIRCASGGHLLPHLGARTVKRYLPALWKLSRRAPGSVLNMASIFESSELARQGDVRPDKYQRVLYGLFDLLSECEEFSDIRHPLEHFLESDWRLIMQLDGVPEMERLLDQFAERFAVLGDLLRGHILGSIDSRKSLALDLDMFMAGHAEEIAWNYPLPLVISFIKSLNRSSRADEITRRIVEELHPKDVEALVQNDGDIPAAFFSVPSSTLMDYIRSLRHRFNPFHGGMLPGHRSPPGPGGFDDYDGPGSVEHYFSPPSSSRGPFFNRWW